jgi:hypothetical protein
MKLQPMILRGGLGISIAKPEISVSTRLKMLVEFKVCYAQQVWRGRAGSGEIQAWTGNSRRTG